MADIGDGALSVTIQDDSSGVNVAVKAASTAPIATDPALVVALSPNGNQATEAAQNVQNTRIGDVSETAPNTDTAPSGLNGRLQRIAQHLTSLIALFPASIGRKSIAGSLSVVHAEADRTYSATSTAVASAAGATDIFTITGSPTAIVRIKRISISGIATADANIVCLLLKRSTANSGGTFTTIPVVPHDSTNTAGTAVVRAYTANPTSLGTLVGAINSVRLGIGTASPGANEPTQARPEVLFETRETKQDIVLRGTNEVLAINLNGVTVNGGLFSCRVEWTEE
jgi:hypothetical protein